MNIIIMGPQNSGKGTHAKFVSEYLGIPHISVGDLFRAEIEKGTPLGLKIKDLVKNGVLVPDDVTLNTLKTRLNQSDCKKGFILDGYPRNLSQAQSLEKLAKIDLVIYLEISHEAIMKRLAGRVICSKCKEIYNTNTYKEKNCKCGGNLVVREDDNEEAIKTRLNIFKNNTLPLVDFYKDKVKKVNTTEGTVEENRAKVKKVVDQVINKTK